MIAVTDYAGPVREYVRYCKRAAAELTLKGSSLDPKYHPTEAGACRLIAHGGDTSEAKKIRAAFRELTEGPPGSAPGTQTTETTDDRPAATTRRRP